MLNWHMGNQPKVGVLIYTCNRVDDARINMEIIRNVWPENELLRNSVIVHSFNGQRQWWPEKYIEDELLHLENPGHFEGAEILLNKGIECFAEKYPDIDYVIILASDTWCVMPGYLEKVIRTMRSEEKYLAACSWGTKKGADMFKTGVSLDFNIVDIKWALRYGLFPMGYKEFLNRYSDVFFYEDKNIHPEKVFALRFRQAVLKSGKAPSENLIKEAAREQIYRITEREPVHIKKPVLGIFGGTVRKMYWPKMGLITHHDPEKKQAAARKWDLKLGDYGNRFLAEKDFSWYNGGLTKTAYIKGNKKIHYND